MIVQCSHCQTRFKLDPAKLKKGKIALRCSRCQQVFTVQGEKPATGTARILAVCNQKGGVAKTSTCLNLGASLAHSGQRVLLVDFDVQANLTTLCGYQDKPSFYDVLEGNGQALQTYLQKTGDSLWLLPAHRKMALLPKKYLPQGRFEYLLQTHLQPVLAHFDYVVIDTPPSMEFFSLNALVAAHHVILPTQCEYLSMNGLGQMEGLISALARRMGHRLDVRVLITLLDPRNTAARVIAERLAAKYKKRLLHTQIEWDARMQEAQIVHKAVIDYDPNSVSSQQYLALAQEIKKLGD